MKLKKRGITGNNPEISDEWIVCGFILDRERQRQQLFGSKPMASTERIFQIKRYWGEKRKRKRFS